MVNNDSLREQIQQYDENYPYSMPSGLIILITVLGTFIAITVIATLLYCQYWHTVHKSQGSSAFWHRTNTEETEMMLPRSPQQEINAPKLKLPQKRR